MMTLPSSRATAAPEGGARPRKSLHAFRQRATLALAAGISALALTLAAPPASAQMDRATTVILARPGPVNTLDPLRADYSETNYIVSALYDTLVTYDREGTLQPNLATEFVTAEDSRSIAVTLRPDVEFHDGTTLTARDVAYTLDRLKRLGAGIAAQIEGYASTEVHDDTHLTIHLSSPNALFVGALSKIYILNSALVEANAGSDDGQAWLQGNDAGSGAFTLDGFQNNAFVLSRFEDYWAPADGRPATLVFRRIDEGATSQAELRAGNVDLVWGLGERDAEAAAAADPNIQVNRVSAPIQADVVFNVQSGPTADARIRNALALAYDYEGAFAGIHSGHGVLGNGPLPTTLACRPDRPQVARDIDAAKALLAEAGASNLELTMKFQPVFDTQAREATLFQSNLADIGVTLNLEPIAFPDYLQSLSNPDTIPQMMLLLDFAQFPDTGTVLIKSFHSSAIGSTNRSGYSNPAVDALLDEAVATPDADRRCEIYQEVQTILDEEGVYMDMYTLDRPIAYRADRVSNIHGSLVVYPIAPAELRLARN